MFLWPKLIAAIIEAHKHKCVRGDLTDTSCLFSKTTAVAFPSGHGLPCFRAVVNPSFIFNLKLFSWNFYSYYQNLSLGLCGEIQYFRARKQERVPLASFLWAKQFLFYQPCFFLIINFNLYFFCADKENLLFFFKFVLELACKVINFLMEFSCNLCFHWSSLPIPFLYLPADPSACPLPQ